MTAPRPRRLPKLPSYPLPAPETWPDSRPAWAFDPSRAALLVHDMQAYFVAAFEAGGDPVRAATRHIAALLQAARATDMPVFFTAQRGNQDRRDRGLQADLWGPGMRAIAEHENIIPALAPQDGDRVLVKHRYSAFQRSHLDELLRARGRDQLLITGLFAHIGCQITAAEAFQRDIQPFFVADAQCDYSLDWHQRSLEWVAATCGVVVGTAGVLALMRDGHSG